MTRSPKTPVFALACGILGYGISAAQFTAMDPVHVAPHIYQNVLENERVRVLKVTERNGETPPVHSHPASLIVHLSPCAWLETSAGGGSRMQSFRLGDAVWREQMTHGGETSQVVQECSRLEIELK